jgi:hypothetical protein
MAKPDQNGGALAGVRLTQVPVRIRRFYGRVLLERALKTMEPMAALEFGAELHRAVENPSDHVYWVAREEIDRVFGQI